MRIAVSKEARSAIVTAGLAVASALPGSAQASVILTSPSLPLIGIPYVSPNGGAGCFDIASVCVTPGPFTQTMTVSSMFTGGNQQIVADATYNATLSPLAGGAPVGSVSLTGTLDQSVEGRTSNAETGAWTTDITGVSLTGTLMLTGSPLNGHTLVVTLGSGSSTGTTTITSTGETFTIDSSFDVFADVSLQGTGLSKSVGPILLVAVPEPSTWAMMLVGFGGLGFAAYRRARITVSAA